MARKSSVRKLGIDFGDRRINMVIADISAYGNSLVGFARHAIALDAKAKDVFREIMDSLDQPVDEVNIALSGSYVTHIVKKMPRISESDLASAITWELKSEEKIQEAEPNFTWAAIGGAPARKSDELELLISVTREKVIEEIIDVLYDTQQDVNIIMSSSSGYVYLQDAYTQNMEETVALLNVSAASYSFMGSQNREVLFYREAPFEKKFAGTSDQQRMLKPHELDFLAEDIARYITYILEFRQIAFIDKIVICGNILNLDQVKTRLESKHDLPVEIFRPDQIFEVEEFGSDPDSLKEFTPEFALAASCAISDDAPRKFDFLPSNYRWQSHSRVSRVFSISFTLLLVMSILLLILNGLALKMFTQTLSDFEHATVEMEAVEQDLSAHKDLKKNFDRYLYQMEYIEKAKAPASVFKPCFAIIAEALPPGAYLDKVRFSKSDNVYTVRISGAISGKDIKLMYQAIEGFKTNLASARIFYNVKLGNIKKPDVDLVALVDDSAVKVLSFDIEGVMRTVDRHHFKDIQ